MIVFVLVFFTFFSQKNVMICVSCTFRGATYCCIFVV